MTPRLTVHDRIEWRLGPRELRRTGTVLYVYSDGSLSVSVDGMKTSPIRRVMPDCQPTRLSQS